MKDFRSYGKGFVFRDKSKNGLLFEFLSEYKKHFKVSVVPSCNKCLNSYWQNHLNLFNMENDVKCAFELHKKYNGITLRVNGRPIRNGEMTNEIALRLLDEHPRGADLFLTIPSNIDELRGVKEDESMTLKELRDKYPEIEAKSKKKFLEKLK